MLANRLRKNVARLAPWAKREGLSAYRVYDRDIPEFPWIIDRYGHQVLVSEYATPVGKRLDAAAHASEREAVLSAVVDVLHVAPEHVHLKLRERHLSAEREAQGSAAHEFPVEEHGLRFLVNLDDYLDTGLFLDHRNARRHIGEHSAGKRVLNLFCYTGAFTVYAAKGDATATVSVDLSATYLTWAERNLKLNGLLHAQHRLVRADVFDYLRGERALFDWIVLDPPTLSRAKRGKSFDVQAAHPELLQLALTRLAPNGSLFFSTNYRQFLLDERSLKGRSVREITAETLPKDFREGIHRSWLIR